MRRSSFDKKTTVEECRALSITWLRKHGYVRPGIHAGSIHWTNAFDEPTGSMDLWSSISCGDAPGRNSIELSYTLTDKSCDTKTNMEYQIGLATTPCHYGAH